MKTVILMMIFTIKGAMACDVQCPITPDNIWAYHDGDKFSWSHPTDQVHMALGFGIALTASEALIRYSHLKPWQAALISAIGTGLIGTVKETMFDTYTSRTDIKTWFIGGFAGGAVSLTLNF